MNMINSNGTVTVTTEVMASAKDIKALLNKMVRSDIKGNSDWIHSRWSVLYNAYDLIYGVNVRQEHIDYRCKISILEYMNVSNKLKNLLALACNLYPNEFEEYRCMEDEIAHV